MAHPIRPDHYVEINNFYTATVYQKGAAIIRMYHTLLGESGFQKGMRLYFERHDGQAVTCEDFVRAMEDASGRDLTQFRRWYSQAGTPRLTVSGDYDSEAATYTPTVEQSCPPTPGQSDKQPFHIPLSMALLGDAGALPLQLQGQAPNPDTADNTAMVLDVIESRQQFVFTDVPEKPVPSLLRGFSAPVKLSFAYDRDELMFLMSRDSDGFCRWDAAQQLGVLALNDMIAAYQGGQAMVLDPRLIEANRLLLEDRSLDKAMVALMLNLPTEAYLAEISDRVDVHAIHAARVAARRAIAEALADQLLAVYRENTVDESYQASAEQIAARSLKNAALSYLMLLESEQALELCLQQYHSAANMTDQFAAFSVLLNSPFEQEKAQVLEDFYQRWQSEALVINQWFTAQAVCSLEGGLQRVEALMAHPAFDIRNPNKVRAVIGAFCGQNAVNFHQKDGAGYRFLADQIIVLNKMNPQIASRLLVPLTKWRKYAEAVGQMMRAELQRIMAEPELSKDVYEVVSKSLAQ